MHRSFMLALLGAFLCCPVLSFSQDEEAVDTVLSTVTLNNEARDTGFDAVGQPLPVYTRTVPPAKLDSLRDEDAFWYANYAHEKKKEELPNNDEPFFLQKWFGQLLWIVVLCGFIAVVLWYLSSSNILLFRKRAKKILAEDESVDNADDIFSLQYDKEIAKAVAAKNFRLAVRLWYLQLLKLLSDKNLIDYRYGRTNGDYVSQLSSTTHYRDFFRLTRNFEYTWYGQFEPSVDAYEMMQAEFVKFKKTVGG